MRAVPSSLILDAAHEAVYRIFVDRPTRDLQEGMSFSFSPLGLRAVFSREPELRGITRSPPVGIAASMTWETPAQVERLRERLLLDHVIEPADRDRGGRVRTYRLRSPGGKGSRSKLDLEEVDSPLPYPIAAAYGLPVRRLLLVDAEAPRAAPSDAYFADTWSRVSRGKDGRKLKIPREQLLLGAGPHAVAFLDFHELGDRSIYLDYVTVRSDQAGKGHARFLVEWLYDQFRDRKSIDWGHVMHDHAEKLWRRMRENTSGPRTYGKLL